MYLEPNHTDQSETTHKRSSTWNKIANVMFRTNLMLMNNLHVLSTSRVVRMVIETAYRCGGSHGCLMRPSEPLVFDSNVGNPLPQPFLSSEKLCRILCLNFGILFS
jgi:hypothetical protein